MQLRADDPLATTLSLAAGLALIEAVDVASPGHALMLKWPNDLLLNNAKLAGILLERSGDRVVIGFGVNLAAPPDLPDRRTASLAGKIQPQAFAPLVAGSFSRILPLWRSNNSSALLRAWQERGHLPGTQVTVHVSKDDVVTGRFAGLEHDGALRLRLGDGEIRVIRAADVELG